MIATATMPAPRLIVPRNSKQDVGLTDSFRGDAAREVEVAFAGISGKRISAVELPGVTRHSISRAMNGCESNPMARLAGWFVLARRLGVPKHRMQRLINWLQAALDAAYADEPGPSLDEVLSKETEKDSAEDPPQMKAAMGCGESLHVWLDHLLDRHAYDRTVIATVSAALWFGPKG